MLLLAGGRSDKKRLTNPIPHCDPSLEFLKEYCEGLKKIELGAMPKAAVERDDRDPRIQAVVPMDSGFVRSFDPASLRAINIPIFLLSADKADSREGGDIFAKEFLPLLPQARRHIVKDSIHISFLLACKPEWKIEPMPSICLGDGDRFAIQKEINERTKEFLSDVFR